MFKFFFEIEKLPPIINTKGDEGDPFISPDESYLIYYSTELFEKQHFRRSAKGGQVRGENGGDVREGNKTIKNWFDLLFDNKP